VLTGDADGPRQAVAEHVRTLVAAARHAGLDEHDVLAEIRHAFGSS
jgi:hypothetical protein